MPDRKPPRVVGDERATLLALLQYQRTSIVGKVEGLTDDEARRSPVPTGTSLLWLVTHLAWAEALWVIVRFAGQPLPPDLADGSVGVADTVTSAVDRYRRTWSLVDAVVADADLGAICVGVREEPRPDLRWVLAHLLEETARHAGHADILRELIDGSTGR